MPSKSLSTTQTTQLKREFERKCADNEWESALKVIQELLKYSVDSREEYIKHHHNLTIVLYNLKTYYCCLDAIKLTEKFYNEADVSDHRIDLLRRKAKCYRHLGEDDLACETMNKALATQKKRLFLHHCNVDPRMQQMMQIAKEIQEKNPEMSELELATHMMSHEATKSIAGDQDMETIFQNVATFTK